MLQWEWLGGLPPIRRAAIIGAGTWGTSLAVALARAGSRSTLAVARTNRRLSSPSNEATSATCRASSCPTRPRDARRRARARRPRPRLPRRAGEGIARRCSPRTASGSRGGPACSCWRRAWYRRLARCPRRSPQSAAAPAPWPSSAVPQRAADLLEHGASIVLATLDRAFARQLAETLRDSRLDVTVTSDVTGVELAGTATNVAVLAAGAASAAGANVAGAAAGKVFAEVDALAQLRGGRPETFAGLAGAGDLVGAWSPRARTTGAPVSCWLRESPRRNRRLARAGGRRRRLGRRCWRPWRATRR